jgi:sialate O-acetylesterase
VFVLALTMTPARAAVRLHGLFASNMVLQHGVPVTVWGYGAEGQVVTLRFKQQLLTTVVTNGNWSVRLAPMPASAMPATLSVTGTVAPRRGTTSGIGTTNGVRIVNVVVGEVWLCSGQSNMERPVAEADNGPSVAAQSANPNLRFFTVARNRASAPTNDVVGLWQPATRDSTYAFSAVGYFFGRDLQAALNVPVGLICSAYSGSTIESWMNRAFLEGNPDYNRDIVAVYQKNYARYLRAKAAYDLDTAKRAAKGLPPAGPPPDPPWAPGELYNGMIAPLLPFPFRGVAWYQGEANASRAWQYRTLLPDFINLWRQTFASAQQDPALALMPFCAVQIAPFKAIQDQPMESELAELREAQVLATQLPKVSLTIITDCGDPLRIHPRRKEPVGARLALAARGIAYNQPIQ